MKKSIIISTLFCFISLVAFSQTKKTTTTTTSKTTKVPVKTTTTTTKTTVKKPTVIPATSTSTMPTVAKPEVVQKEQTTTQTVVQQPAGPPVTGKTVEGPKSYTTGSQAVTTKTTTTKTTIAKEPNTPKMKVGDAVHSYIGIRGGYNLSTVQDVLKDAALNNVVAKEKYQPGLMGGLVFNIGVSRSFSIQPEVLYSQQGLKVVSGTDYLIGKYNIVNAPLLLKLAFGGKIAKFFINAGPYIGYKLDQSAELNYLGNVLKEKHEFVKDYDANGLKDNRIDFGGIGGAGLQFNLGGPMLVLEGRYQYGMADPTLYKDGKPAEIGSQGHTRVITGTLGLLFPIGK
jgi:Outer membrane protein beta-barrel domain